MFACQVGQGGQMFVWMVGFWRPDVGLRGCTFPHSKPGKVMNRAIWMRWGLRIRSNGRLEWDTGLRNGVLLASSGQFWRGLRGGKGRGRFAGFGFEVRFLQIGR